jgi:hypothetical protein
MDPKTFAIDLLEATQQFCGKESYDLKVIVNDVASVRFLPDSR